MKVDLFAMSESIYSQNGEDGILSALLPSIGLEMGYFVEFGAWDGIHWSNTYGLYKRGWKGCLIENNVTRYQQLVKNIPDQEIIKLQTEVTPSGTKCLDSLLTNNGVRQIDLLSIDIDSDDLLVWEGVRKYRPKVVVIEYNPTIPFDTYYINPVGKCNGNSALSITKSAENRGYTLLEGTDTNLFFLLDEIANTVDFQCKSLQQIRDQTTNFRIFVSNDGTLLHDLKLLEEAKISEIFPIPFALGFGIQPLPKWTRKVRKEANYLGLVWFSLTALCRCPVQYFRLIKHLVRTILIDHGPKGILNLFFDKNRFMKLLKEKEETARNYR